MNYSKELQKIEDFFMSEYYKEAGRNCGVILESVLKDIYEKVRSNAPSEIIKKLNKIEEKQSNGRGGTQNFMLGQLAGLFREGDIFKYVETSLNIKCRLSKKIPLDELTKIRNKCTHSSEYTPTLEELHFFLSHLKILLSETGYLKTTTYDNDKQNSNDTGIKNELSKIRKRMLMASTLEEIEPLANTIDYWHPSYN